MSEVLPQRASEAPVNDQTALTALTAQRLFAAQAKLGTIHAYAVAGLEAHSSKLQRSQQAQIVRHWGGRQTIAAVAGIRRPEEVQIDVDMAQQTLDLHLTNLEGNANAGRQFATENAAALHEIATTEMTREMARRSYANNQ